MGMNEFSEEYRQRMREQFAFRKWMRKWRRRLGMSQAEMAAAVSSSRQSTVSYWENGTQAIPDNLIGPITEFLVSQGASSPPPIEVSDPDYKPPAGRWRSPEYAARHQSQATFRKWMTATRNSARLTQSELGRRTGLSQEAISFYENGLQAIPQEMIRPIEDALLAAANDGRSGLEGQVGYSETTISKEDGELENEGYEEHITDPFDPSQIKIQTRPVLIEQLVSRVKFGEIDLTPDFQRLRGIWDQRQKSRLIESILLRIPLPVFYVAADDDESWIVVDGVQRMSTISDYVNAEFALRGLEYLTWLNGKSHDELPRRLQRRISETQLVVHVIESGTPESVMFNVFLRINTGGMTLNAQEIRHALHPGPVRDYLKELAASEEFLEATGGINSTRMMDRECVLRYLAFSISDPEAFSAIHLDGFLGQAMEKINMLSDIERCALADQFKRSMRLATAIFGRNAFRKPPTQDRRFPVNRALFETWGVHLGRCSQRQIETLIERRDEVVSQFKELIAQDQEFGDSISYGTGSSARIRKRFSAIRELVEGLI